MTRPPGAALAGPALVLGAALVATFWGIEVRDLSSTELEEFNGSGPLGILLRSITPTENDWGAHMPLSHLIRVTLVQILGETQPLAWRLHVAVASCGAALLTWWLARPRLGARWAVGAGLLVAVHPVVSFHAHESTNYGFGALLGALLLLALLRWEEGARRGPLLLTLAAFLGLSNDLFFAFPLAVALGWTAWRAARTEAMRSAFLKAWGGLAALIALPALWFVSHAVRLQQEHVIGPHADPIPEESRQMLGAAWDLLRRFAGGYVGGYLDAGEADLWLVGGPVVLVALLAGVLLRAPDRPDAGRTAAWLAVGAFALILFARLLFGALTGREFTTEPRIYTALVAPLAVGWTALCARVGGRTGTALLALLIGLMAIPTARQLATLSDRDSRAASLIQRLADPDDAIVVSRQVGWRLAPELRGRSHQGCVPSETSLPSRVWLALEEDGEQLQDVRDCDGQVLARPGEGWEVRHHDRYMPPPYDRKSASFLPELVVAVLERSGDSPPLGPRALAVQRSLGGGSAELELAVLAFEGSERPDMRSEPDMGRVPVPPSGMVARAELPSDGWVRFTVERRSRPENSLGGLLRPLGHPLVDLDAVPVLRRPIEPLRTLDLPPFSSPGLRIVERLLRTLLAVGLLVGLALRRR